MATHRQLPCSSWGGRGGSLPRIHDITCRRWIVGRPGCEDLQHLAGAEGGDEGRRRDLGRRRRRHRVGLQRVCAAAGAGAKCDPAQRQAPAGCSSRTSCAAKGCVCHGNRIPFTTLAGATAQQSQPQQGLSWARCIQRPIRHRTQGRCSPGRDGDALGRIVDGCCVRQVRGVFEGADVVGGVVDRHIRHRLQHNLQGQEAQSMSGF